MEQNLQRLRVRSQNDDFRNTTVQSLRGCIVQGVNYPTMTMRADARTFIGSLLELLVLLGLLNEIEDLKTNR